LSRFAGLIRASLLCAAIAALPPIAAADPFETDPDLATSDEDYAAGKRAVEKKDWAEAARLFQRAEIRHPDHADLQNILSYSYRNLKQYDLAFKHYKRHRARSAPSRRAWVHGGAISRRGTSGRGGTSRRSRESAVPQRAKDPERLRVSGNIAAWSSDLACYGKDWVTAQQRPFDGATMMKFSA
jgi:tetratricopeptide (TPR) repeat protein